MLNEYKEKWQKISELAKILTGENTCGDCLSCEFHTICYEEEKATYLVNLGYEKVEKEQTE